MPELPEVETVVRQLRERVTGRKITGGQILRAKSVRGMAPERFLQQVKGRTIQAVDRRAKYIIFRLDNGLAWISHLGMTGKFVVNGTGRGNGDHVRARVRLTGGKDLVFTDLRIFGFMTALPERRMDDYFRRTGVEPLTKDLNLAYLQRALGKRGTSIKAALLDQKIIAGIGNIYASETLFDARISPRRAANRLTRAHVNTLIASIQRILKQAIRYNGTTILNYRGVDNQTGRFRTMLKVYGRENEPCRKCRAPIRRIVQGQRSTFYCPRCQT